VQTPSRSSWSTSRLVMRGLRRLSWRDYRGAQCHGRTDESCRG
jgi:hypothetical protein